VLNNSLDAHITGVIKFILKLLVWWHMVPTEVFALKEHHTLAFTWTKWNSYQVTKEFWYV